MILKNKYFLVEQEKETKDLYRLRDMIKEDGFMTPDTIIVTCSPDYSGIGSQILNHGLSHINRNELYEQLSMELPYPNSNQVFNRNTFEYELFDKYLTNWVNSNMTTDMKYLFFDSGTLSGRNFSKIKQLISAKGNYEYRFSCLYLQDDSKFKPDFFVDTFNFKEQGGLLFYWENMDNPNWNY